MFTQPHVSFRYLGVVDLDTCTCHFKIPECCRFRYLHVSFRYLNVVDLDTCTCHLDT